MLDPNDLRLVRNLPVRLNGLKRFADRLLIRHMSDQDDIGGFTTSNLKSGRTVGMPGIAGGCRRCTMLSSETFCSAIRLAIAAIAPGRS